MNDYVDGKRAQLDRRAAASETWADPDSQHEAAARPRRPIAVFTERSNFTLSVIDRSIDRSNNAVNTSTIIRC